MTQASDLVDYYVNTLILQYAGKPKAAATIGAVVYPVIMPTASGTLLPNDVQGGFNVTGSSIAVGAQLDVIGLYAGVVRTGTVNGVQITLSDADFTTLIQIAIIKNYGGSSLAFITDLIYQFFGTGIAVYDHKTMRMSYLISSAVGSQDLVQLMVTEGLLPVPMAVAVAVVYAPVINMFFGFRTYEAPAVNVTPFNDYVGYHMDWPWLDYADTIHP